MSGFGPRFVVEVAFLPLLAPWIIAVMVVGWGLVTLVEWLAWRSETAPEEPRVAAEPGPDEQTSWDIEEILAPVPEDDER